MPSVIAPPGAPHTQFSPPPIKSFSLSSPAKSTNINSLDSKPLTVDELMRLRCQLTPDQAIVSYPSSGINYVDYTPRQLDVFAYRAAEQYALRIPQRKSSDEKPLVIGLLGPSNLDYLITFLALSKLGHTVLFLSTRISKEAYLSLLNATDSRNLVIHSSFRDMATKLQGDLSSLRVDELVGEQTYHYALGSAGIDTRMSQDFNLETESKHIAWIIHSSGSTGLPKPILQTHKAAVNNYATNMDMRGFITLPLYHAHGLSSFFRAISSGKQIHLYNASLPLAKQHIIDIMRNNRFEIFYGVPYALKLLAESTEGIELLASCKIVMFGGSSCPDSLGDKLVENGVNLVSHFGTYVPYTIHPFGRPSC
jgi:acyl-CoA synthetase (AMP-forming)/AMP-acid ligase II